MPTQIELVKELSIDHNNWHEKYPWFSLGRLLNVADKRANDYPAIQSAAIFFNDIQRFHWLLHEPAFSKNKILSELNVPISTEGMQATPQPFPKREHPQEIIIPNNLIAVAAVDENDAIQLEVSIEKKQLFVGDVIIHQAINIEEKKAGEATNDQLETQTVESISSPNVFVQQPENIGFEQSGGAENILGATNEVAVSEDIDQDNEEQSAPEIATETNSVENIKKSQESIKAALNNSEGDLQFTFEPYHTIDYFASQGIKVDTKIDDKLGKQLKSFTSWLKSMKRLPTAEDSINNAPAIHINDKSLENTNVITEAMASVLIKQGKKEQAAEIFRQLSLLHPEKSRYFAAQIEQIKI